MTSPIIVAMDVPRRAAALALADKLDQKSCRLKVGMELFTRAGPQIIEDLQRLGFEIFLDLKYHDIPNTVTGAIRAAMELGVWMTNVHCLGGPQMLEAAAKARQSVAGKSPILIGVTVLTSMDAASLDAVGIHDTPQNEVLRLAKLAQDAGLDGVVCSGQEAATLRAETSGSFVLVTPGIRLPEGSADDQARIMTPEKAVMAGANYLVVGRPITGAPDPRAALHEFNTRIASLS